MSEEGAPGPRNAITDVDGISVGAAHDAKVRTGVSVVLPAMRAVCAVDVRGGGPGTRETDALDPSTLVDAVDAVVLAGGSVYGLAAADGVVAWLGAQGKGFNLVPKAGVPPSPIAPSAILYDLANGGDKAWGETPPYRDLGRAACAAASAKVDIGDAGAGYGAMAGALKGGLGTASWTTPDGVTVGALVAVNSFGSTVMPGTDVFWAWPFERQDEFGGRRPSPHCSPVADFPPDTKLAGASAPGPAPANTTIGVVATNVALTPAKARRLAIMAQDGLARAIRPIHGPTDGDVIFALSTGAAPMAEPAALSLTRLGLIAADCVARAVARGVYAAGEAGFGAAYASKSKGRGG